MVAWVVSRAFFGACSRLRPGRALLPFVISDGQNAQLRGHWALKTGLPLGERRTLLTALLADGINMSLKRMAEACRGASFWQLARVVDWHVREETYVQATARLVDAQRALPIALVWGDGTMSSSDGQFFQAGGHGLAPSEVNARYGSEPGVSFYSHLSDQFGAFYSKVIAATAHEAPHRDASIAAAVPGRPGKSTSPCRGHGRGREPPAGRPRA